MTDWIEHTTDTCPVDPETVVEVRYGSGLVESDRANKFPWWMLSKAGITHYRIITPAKPPEPEMTHSYPDDAESYAQNRIRPEMNADAAAALKRRIADAYRAGEDAQALKAKARANPEPDLITLRLECLKLAAGARVSHTDDLKDLADILLHYVLNGSVDKAGK
jgi:hypothetical protein